jgi:hypothetical protein
MNALAKVGDDTASLENKSITDIASVTNTGHLAHVGIVQGDLVWFADSADDNEVTWCLDLNIKVFVKDSGFINSSGSYEVYSKGEYGKANSASDYCCAPDLTGFDTSSTYYCEYTDVTAKVPPISSAIYNQPSSNWYTYSSSSGTSKWANVVTVNNHHVAYWVWIPRYVYKVEDTEVGFTSAIESGGKVDIKFVDTNNQYTDSNGNKVSYAKLQEEGYVLPDAFTFGEGTELSGFWVCKYEISDPLEPTGFSVETEKTSISITGINWSGTSNITNTITNTTEDITVNQNSAKIQILTESGEQKYPINNAKPNYEDIPATIDGLNPNTKYIVNLTVNTYYGEEITLTKTVKTAKATIDEMTAPDLSGFDLANTSVYFVKFDSTDPTIGDKITSANITTDTVDTKKKVATNAPSWWYNYTASVVTTASGSSVSAKQWANILVEDANGDRVFLVWIPRYEYKITETNDIDILFISRDQTVADDGYEIPDAFKFGDTELSGIWVSKYELSNPMVPSGFNTIVDNGNITITEVLYSGSSNLNTGSLTNSGITITIEGIDTSNSSVNIVDTGLIIKKDTNEYTLKGPSDDNDNKFASGWYKITMKIPNTYNAVGGNIFVEVSQTVYVPDSTSGSGIASAPDITYLKTYETDGTDKNYVYYLDYGEDGSISDATVRNLESGKVPTSAYNYSEQRWANVLVTKTKLLNSDTDTMKVSEIDEDIMINIFTWIPRYEYKIESSGNVSIVFINSTTTAHSKGSDTYIIPDAFTFGDDSANKNLSGFWVQKYEISGETKTIPTN